MAVATVVKWWRTATRVHHATLAAVMMMLTLARAVGVQAQTRSFDIPAQPLATALTTFGRQSGLQVSAPSELVEGKTSTATKGDLSPGQALGQLLTGTGLTFRLSGTTVTLARAPQTTDGSVQLDPLRVQGEGVASGVPPAVTTDPAATEGTGSYTSESLSTATRLPLSIRETPQTVTVITRDRMNDQAMIKVGDALRNTPGLSATSFSGPNREAYYARGFLVQNYTFDGIPSTFTTAGQGLVNDLSMYDRVEVVRGSTGITQGTGTPSAAINFVRKRPTKEGRATVQAQFANWSHLGVLADVSGPLNASGSIRGRAVANVWHSDSFQDVADEGRQLFYGIAEADITKQSMVTLSVSHLGTNGNTTYAALPTALEGGDLKLPRSTYLGNDWNYWDETNTSLYGAFQQRFGGNWKLNASFNQIWGGQDRFVTGNYLNGNGLLDQTGNFAGVQNDRTSLDVNATGGFQLFGRTHELVAGGGGRRAKEGNDTAGYWPPIYLATDIDPLTWTHDFPEPATTLDYHYRGTESQYGAYGTARLNVADPLKVTLGIRVDSFDTKSTDDIYDWDAEAWTLYQNGYDYHGHFTKYAGLVYDVGARHSVYASYSDIFQPQSERSVDNQFLTPIIGRNYEVGLKGEYFDGALNVSGALFQIDQDNRAMPVGPCPFNPVETCYRAAGVVRSRGFDFDVQGALSQNWQIGGGFGTVNPQVVEDADPAQIGVRLNTELPRQQLKLFTSRRLANRWLVGGNLRVQGRVFHYDNWNGYDYNTEQNAHAIIDALFGYRQNTRLGIQLNITNLLDTTYYSVINTQPAEWGGNAMYGAPRRLMLTVNYTF